MGYSTCGSTCGGREHLCCDFCGKSVCSGAQKVAKKRCPFGYCPAAATCGQCAIKERDKFTKQAHEKYGCKQGHEEYQARQNAEQMVLESGGILRCSALAIDGDTVHVLFRDKEGANTGYFMTRETYHTIPLGVPATPDDYRKSGVLMSAPSDFYRS